MRVAAGARAGHVLVIGHIRHDLRNAPAPDNDAEAARALADRLGVPFVRADVRVRPLPGNPEANARAARYRALSRLARTANCPFIATGHHADDQLESVLMALLRGAGPAGLRGCHETRRYRGVTIIRPMLSVTRAQARGLCGEAGLSWREDDTNADTTRLRAGLRSRVLPELERLRPGAAARAARAAALLADAADLVRASAEGIPSREIPGGVSLDAAALAAAPRALAGEALRLAAVRAGETGRDRIGPQLRSILAAMADGRGTPRRFPLGHAEVLVRSGSVEVRPRTRAPGGVRSNSP